MTSSDPGELPREQEAGLEALLGRGSGFRRRLAFGALAGIAVLVVLGSFLAWRQYEDGKQKAVNEMHARVALASAVFDTYFAGRISTLQAVASAPSVVRIDTALMDEYLRRVQGDPKKPLFTQGLGWIDRMGHPRASDKLPLADVDLSDRLYFKRVMATGKPFISGGLVSRVQQTRVMVMAVPTRDQHGRLTGVLTGGINLTPPKKPSERSIELGFADLSILDRSGQQLTSSDFAVPANRALLTKLRRGDGVLSDTKGLAGDGGHVVAYANSSLPGWTTVLDKPRSQVFAAARRSFLIELISIIVAAIVAAGLVAWAISRSRRELAAERDQMRRWDELTQSLGDASAASEVSAALGSALTTAFPGADVLVALHDDERGGFRVWTYGGADRGALDRRAPGVTEVARLVFASGSPLRLTDPAVLETLLAPLSSRLGGSPGELFSVPMRTQSGVTMGSSTLLLPAETRLSDADEALVVAHTEYAARALSRARRSEREHDVAVALQRSLLPAALPYVEGIEVAARYNAGAADLEVGGDWYGLIRRPDGIVHLTVGDVAGRGITAAVLMGQLRYAFRALAYELVEPAEIARRLSRLVPEGSMATATFLALDPYTGELSYASAGHPPSMLLDPLSSEVTLLDGAAAPPLGWTNLEGIEEARVTLHAGMTLLAYTDGLVERRGFGIDEGIQGVAQLVGRRSQLGAEQMADELLETIAAPVSASDDIALLIVQLLEVPSVMTVELPADPSMLRTLRARINCWLERRGVVELKRLDAILAVSEACNNAIEHAYANREGTIRLTLEHAAGALGIVVEDDGMWREATPDPTRGRGLMIMRETMDSIEVVSGESGTRVELELGLVEAPTANKPTSAPS